MGISEARKKKMGKLTPEETELRNEIRKKREELIGHWKDTKLSLVPESIWNEIADYDDDLRGFKEDYDQKTAKLTPEEMELRKENLQAREAMDDSAVHRLCATICLGAVCDYNKIRKKRAALLGRWEGKKLRLVPKSVQNKIAGYYGDLREIEEFFDSDMFTTFTGMSGKEEAIRHINKVPRSYMDILERRDA